MKTLDEVIEAIGFCKSGNLSKCKDCPYIGTCESDYAVLSDDALHYLWEYRTEQKILSDSKEHYEYWEHKYYAELEKNDPLTWDELRTMEGKPVWVEDRAFIDGEEYFDSKWAIVCQVKDKFAMLSIAEGDTCFQKCNYVYDIPGTDHWQAYRKERP